jgi:hypothetical protein
MWRASVRSSVFRTGAKDVQIVIGRITGIGNNDQSPLSVSAISRFLCGSQHGTLQIGARAKAIDPPDGIDEFTFIGRKPLRDCCWCGRP